MTQLKLKSTYKGGNNSMKLDPNSLNEALKQPYWMKLDETKSMIRGHLENFKRPHVATSWGLDSTILSFLVKQVCDEIDIKPNADNFPIFALNHTRNIYKEEPAYWKTIVSFLQIPDDKFKIFYPLNNKTVWSIAKDVGFLPLFRRSTKDKYIPYKFRKEPDCCEQLKKESVNEYLKSIPKNLQFDLSFVGTRANESQARRLNILMHCRTYSTNYQRPYKIRVNQPLAFWTEKDIEQCFNDNNIPKNPAYEVHNQQRLGCASCPAHIHWEERLAGDPTNDGQGMLMQNLRILRVTQPNRFQNTITRLRKKNLAENLILKVLNEKPLEGWNLASFDEELIC